MALTDGFPVVMVRTIIRVFDSDKKSAEQIATVAATPRHPNLRNKEQKDTKNMRDTKGNVLGGVGFLLLETPIQEQENPVPRDFRITAEILAKFGYTKGFAGCEAKISGTRHQGRADFQVFLNYITANFYYQPFGLIFFYN